MMLSKGSRVYPIFEINLAMLFISTSGVLGRYIQLSVPVTIGSRALIAFVLLALYCKIAKLPFKVARKDWFKVSLCGFLMGLHWLSYFYALKLSNVAIGMLSIFTFPVWTALLEPILLKTKFQKMHLFLCVLVLTGVCFLIPDFDLKNSYTLAIIIGLFSAIVYAVRNILMKAQVMQYNGSLLMTYQTGLIGFLLLPALFFASVDELMMQWKPLLTLALLTTAIGHTMFLLSLKHFSVTTTSILSSIQPVYGILLGVLFLDEIPSWSTIWGGLLILSAIFIESKRTFQ